LTGAFPTTGGLFSVQVSELRARLIDVAEAAPLLASEIRLLADDMEELRIALALGNIREEMADVQFMSTVGNQIAACGSSGTVWGAAATCANSLAQIHFASTLRDPVCQRRLRQLPLDISVLTGGEWVPRAEAFRSFWS
ncbi:MAG TPA: hypothetical protein VF989_21160, partial [Polyangiaceae bacterium]